MKSIIKTCILTFIIFEFLLGIVYPLIVTGFSNIIFPYQSNGSLVYLNKNIVGSYILGQDFTSDKYFHGRPMQDTISKNITILSGGTNLGPTSKAWLNEVDKRIEKIRNDYMLKENQIIPSELVTISGSGLDPDISLNSAYLQIPRISKIRNISENQLKDIINKYKIKKTFWIIGEERVNILKLNLALDSIEDDKVK